MLDEYVHVVCQLHAGKAFASAMDGVNVDFAGAKIDLVPRRHLRHCQDLKCERYKQRTLRSSRFPLLYPIRAGIHLPIKISGQKIHKCGDLRRNKSSLHISGVYRQRGYSVIF